MTVTTKSSVEWPDSNTVEALEQVGRLFDTDPTARTLPQFGSCALPLALIQPVFETIVQESAPAVPPIRSMSPLGAPTVTEQFAPEFWVCVPPGHCSILPEGELVMWNVTVPDGQPAAQMRLPLWSTPVTDWPFGHDWPARPLPGGPCGPRAPPVRQVLAPRSRRCRPSVPAVRSARPVLSPPGARSGSN